MAVTAKFAADFSDFQSAVSKAEVSLRGFETGAGRVETSLNKMANSLSGTKLIQDAALMAEAVEKVGGVSKLTENELARVSAQATEAANKLRALGQDVPPGIQKIADATRTATKETMDWKGALSSTASAFGVAFSVGAVVAFGKSVFDSASKIGDLAAQLGISTDAVQGFQFAAEQSGSSLDAVGTALTKMNQNLAGGDKSTVKALKDAGLGFAQIRDMKPEDAFLAITDAIQRIEDPMTQTDVALQLFGKSAAELLPAIKEGFRGVSDGANKMSADTIASLKAAQDAWSELGRNVTIVSGNIISATMSLGKAVTASGESFATFARNVLLFGPGAAANMAVAFDGAAKAGNNLKDTNLALPGPIRQTAEQLAAAAAEAKRFADAFAKWSGAKATADMKLLDAVFRELARSGKLTRDEIDGMVKEAIRLQGEGAKLTTGLWEMARATDALTPHLGTAALNLHNIGTQVDIAAPKMLNFQLSVKAGLNSWAEFGFIVGKPTVPDAVKKATDSVGELSRALAQLATVSGGSLGTVVQGLSTIVSAVNTAQKGIKDFTGGLSAFKSGDLLSGITSMSTGIMGMASAAIAAAKAIAGLFDRNKGRDLVVDFAETFGGFDQLHVQLSSLGAEGEKLWIALTQGVGRNNPKEAQAAIDAITKALEKKADASDEAVVMSEAEAQATIETAAEAAKALDDVNERLKVNRDAWGEWSEDVTGYLQKLADDIRAMPLPTPGGPSTTSGGGTSGGRYTGGASAPGSSKAGAVHVYIGNDAVDDHVLRVVRTKTPGDLMVRGR
jgi:hypothetical protein